MVKSRSKARTASAESTCASSEMSSVRSSATRVARIRCSSAGTESSLAECVGLVGIAALTVGVCATGLGGSNIVAAALWSCSVGSGSKATGEGFGATAIGEGSEPKPGAKRNQIVTNASTRKLAASMRQSGLMRGVDPRERGSGKPGYSHLNRHPERAPVRIMRAVNAKLKYS